jgi:two-component system, chemotaxis family, protein-glutamate methylesterase/glutaminase
MNDIKLIAIGGSAGSLHIVLDLVTAIPCGFPAPLLLVLHRNGLFESSLEELLSSRTSLQIREVEEKDPIAPGTIYICPADYHVLIEKDHSFSLDYSERVNYSRPSIDVSFKSAADAYGKELLCLLLSGGNADGAEGLEYVKEKGGVTVVQDPLTAEVPFMPQCAINRTKIDFILPPSRMPALLFPPAFIFPV